MDLPQPDIRPTGRKISGKPEFVLLADFELPVVFGKFRVASGFKTDFASIPRCLWWIASPTDPDILVPSLVHDELYRLQSRLVDRVLADAVFCYLMRLYGAPWWKRVFSYLAVRAFGWLAFRR